MRGTVMIGAVLVWAGCSEVVVLPQRGTTMSTGRNQDTLYVASGDEGTVSRIDVRTKEVQALAAEGRPDQLVAIGDRVYVSLRDKRGLLVLRDTGSGLVKERVVPVDAEPTGLAASPDGGRLYVAASLNQAILEVDTALLEVTRRINVSGEPRWLAMHPSGEYLYGAGGRGEDLWALSLEDGQVRPIPIPAFVNMVGLDAAVALQPRVTGAMTLSRQADRLFVPVLYVDNTSELLPFVDGSFAAIDANDGYASAGRFEPMILEIPVDGDGEPDSEDAEVVSLPCSQAGYASSVSAGYDDDTILVTIEGNNQVAVMDMSDKTEVGQAADAALVGDRPVFLSRVETTPRCYGAPKGGKAALELSDGSMLVHGAVERVVRSTGLEPNHLDVEVSAPRDAQLELGRELFYSAIDPRVVSIRGGVSCATCHFDGRDDGLTWKFFDGPRQTLSLAGHISETAPFRWAGTEPSLASNAQHTALRMGGLGLSDDEARAIALYIDTIPRPDLPGQPGDEPAVERGRAIFERPDVACATCHAGSRYTDLRLTPMFGMSAVKTRSLIGIAASAPYLHDGSAPTLRDVVLRSRDGSMGNTSTLSDAEVDDLVAFLRSL